MREVLNLRKGDVNDSFTSGSNVNEDMSSPKSKIPVRVSNQPGYLDLSPEQAKRLIKTEPIQDYYNVEDEPFARGKYATVRRCRHKATGHQFAAKFLRKRRSADLRAEIIHEIAVLEACKHSSRIVKLHEVFESSQEMILLLELACGGELQMLLDKDEVPTERQVVRLMKQILDGLIDLHSIDVAHLDIKPQNLVLTGEYPDCDVKLCDFGISRYLSLGVDVREILGTPDYVAPEVLNFEPISLATDMWSVGVLLYVLLTGCSPFGGDTKQETFCNITQCRLDFPDDLFEDISEEAKDLMRKLMCKNPSKRLSALECLQHEWFKLPHDTLSNSLNASSLSIATTPRTPTSSKKLAPTMEHSDERSLSFDRMETSSTCSSVSASTTATIEKSNVDDLLNLHQSLPERDPIQNLKDQSQHVNEDVSSPNKGISEERRKSFKNNMKQLVQRLEDEVEIKDISSVNSNNNNNNNDSSDKNCSNKLNNNCSAYKNDVKLPENSNNYVKRNINDDCISNSNCINNNESSYNFSQKRTCNDSKTSVWSTKSPINDNIVTDKLKSSPLMRNDSYRNIARASGMQTMPVSRIMRYQIDRSCNIYSTPNKQNLLFHHTSHERDMDQRSESIFKFRRVFILDDSEDNGVSPPPSINGSLSSENSSISDSNSDTISEMSIDSSSDRSSVISLDDSFDFIYGKSLTNSRHYSSCYNVWEAAKSQNTSSRGWPRECSGSVARALSKFTTSSDVNSYKEGNFHRQRKSLTIFNSSASTMTTQTKLTTLTKTTTSLSSSNSNNKKCIGLELMQEKSGNVVVIREVKAVHGNKFPRCSEVKCESVQSRIRRLQIQNGLQTELAKQRYDIF